MELTPEILKSKWAELSHGSLQVADTRKHTTLVNIDNVGPDFIAYSYKTMPGNQPKSYGNYIAVWQSEEIPWNTPPLATQQIPTDTQSGSAVFTGLSVTKLDYIIGYAVGPMLNTPNRIYGNICSSSHISPATNDISSSVVVNDTAPSLRTTFVGPNSLAADYDNLPDGIALKSNGGWAGIWRGGAASYIDPPLASIAMLADVPSGGFAFNNITLAIDTTYTLALFTSGWSGGGSPNNQKTMACSVSFTLKNK